MNKVDDFLEKLMKLEQFHKTTQCPTHLGNVRQIRGKCIFYEKQALDYENAQDNCENIFGPGNSGRLYEPQTLEEHDEICNEADQVYGGSRWMYLGIRDRDNDEIRRYASSGIKSKILPWGCV